MSRSIVLNFNSSVLSSSDVDENVKGEGGYKLVPIDSLSAGAHQPRKVFDDSLLNLSESIKKQGLLEPIVVRANKKDTACIYEIIAGERRWRAAKLAGVNEVPVVIKDISDNESLIIALIENLQREDLNPIEEGMAYKQLLEDSGLTHNQIGEQVGKSRVAISNIMRLLNLEPEVQQMLIEGLLNIGHARPLLSLEREPQLALAHRIVDLGLSARDAERLAAKANNPSQSSSASIDDAISSKIETYMQRLNNRLSSKIKIKVNSQWKGKAIINFESEQELALIVDQIDTVTAEEKRQEK